MFADVCINVHINIHINLLNFVCIVVFDVETAMQNEKSMILESLVMKMFSAPSQPWWRQIRTFFSGKFTRKISSMYFIFFLIDFV